MTVNVTFLGSFLLMLFLVFIGCIGALAYYLGQRKTQTPRLTALIGTALAIIPFLGLIYLAALVLKNDINPE